MSVDVKLGETLRIHINMIFPSLTCDGGFTFFHQMKTEQYSLFNSYKHQAWTIFSYVKSEITLLITPTCLLCFCNWTHQMLVMQSGFINSLKPWLKILVAWKTWVKNLVSTPNLHFFVHFTFDVNSKRHRYEIQQHSQTYRVTSQQHKHYIASSFGDLHYHIIKLPIQQMHKILNSTKIGNSSKRGLTWNLVEAEAHLLSNQLIYMIEI